MKRRIYVICQKSKWDKGSPQVLSDGFGGLEYVYASKEGLLRAKQRVKLLNKIKGKNPVHLRKATLIVEGEVVDALELGGEQE